MPLTSYCKKCAQDVPVSEVCPHCGAKLPASSVRLTWCVEHTPVRDWICWNSIMRLIFPLLSGVLTGMPGPAVLPGMMVECGVYGLVCGLMMLRVHTGKLYADLYISQITAMLLGRVLSGVCKALLFAPATFSIAAWATASFVTGLPGIIIQLVLLPSLVVALTKARLLRVRYA